MKNILISGGSKGIGLDISKYFLEMGYRVISLSRSFNPELKSSNFDHYDCDITDEQSVTAALKKIHSKYGFLDGLVNNAGFSEWRPIEKINEEFLNKIFATNLFGSFYLIKEALPRFNKNAAIVNISSIAGKRGSLNNSAYCATKFAMNGMTQALSKEIGKNGIRINAICPVLIETPGLKKALNSDHSPAKDYRNFEDFIDNFITTNTALGRLPSALDVASMTKFLLSSEAHSITGQYINLDCGVLPQ